jgi:hypothetical protein
MLGNVGHRPHDPGFRVGDEVFSFCSSPSSEESQSMVRAAKVAFPSGAQQYAIVIIRTARILRAHIRRIRGRV